jgi:hypothetical protein
MDLQVRPNTNKGPKTRKISLSGQETKVLQLIGDLVKNKKENLPEINTIK